MGQPIDAPLFIVLFLRFVKFEKQKHVCFVSHEFEFEFEFESYVIGYKTYKRTWTPVINEGLSTEREPESPHENTPLELSKTSKKSIKFHENFLSIMQLLGWLELL